MHVVACVLGRGDGSCMASDPRRRKSFRDARDPGYFQLGWIHTHVYDVRSGKEGAGWVRECFMLDWLRNLSGQRKGFRCSESWFGRGELR